MNGPRIYVDHAATTPMREEAIEAMLPYLASVGYNPSSLHAEGRASRNALDTARERVAAALGARPREIVFVGSGSESDNLAIAGTVRAAQTKNAIARPHVVTVATEHHAVVHAVDRLAEDGVAVTKLDVDEDGRVDPAAFEAALRPSTVLASVMLANNEIGTIAPIAELAAIAHAHGVPFHTDAVQTPGRLPLDVRALGVDLLTLSGHKFYGPKGVGMLYIRTGTPLAAAIHGGGQEFGLRAGTENVAGIVAFGAALELAVREEPTESPRLAALRDRLEAGVRATVTGVLVNAARARRLPNIASIAFEGTTAPDLLASLDLDGVAASAGSACAAGAVEPSHVLAALGGPPWRRVATIRFSLGKLTSERDIELLIGVIGASVHRLRVVPTELGMGANGQVIRGPEVRS